MPAEDTPLNFDELLGDLREFAGRVIRAEIRLEGQVIAEMEGEFNNLDADDPDQVSFEVGGKEPPARDDIQFIVASWGAAHISKSRFAAARRQSSGIGAFIITIEMTDGVQIRLWPAMPPRKQWTDQHNVDR